METLLKIAEETRTIHLLEGMEDSMTRLKIEELRYVIEQALKTFEYRDLTMYARSAQELAKKTQWDDADFTKARCLIIYHGYLLFYSDDKCPECRAFLSKIRQRYQSAHQLQEAA